MKVRHALMLGLGGAAIAALLIEPSLAQTPTPEAAVPAAVADAQQGRHRLDADLRRPSC